MTRNILITGVMGGIGQALARAFHEKGWRVVGLDRTAGHLPFCDHILVFDLDRYCTDTAYRQECGEQFDRELPQLHALINNAAVQLLGSLTEVVLDDWNRTLNVNLTAPLLLSQFFADRLAASGGSIVNIASIHQQLTKKRFLAYATSKSALVGLTKALSVDLQGRIRVNSISPAAIDTEMLRDGFGHDEGKVQQLNEIHPVQRIGRPEEVARLAVLLAENELGFINGANLSIDGGISNVLKDLD